MNECDKVPSKATPESHPSKTPTSSNEKSSPIAGEKRKNLTREAKIKQTDELPPPLPKTKPKSKPRSKPELKIHPRAQSVNNVVERNYFE
jgi:hypothetical protein